MNVVISEKGGKKGLIWSGRYDFCQYSVSFYWLSFHYFINVLIVLLIPSKGRLYETSCLIAVSPTNRGSLKREATSNVI